MWHYLGLDGRDKELCKPLIQLFYNTKAQKEIKAALQKFVEARNQRKESTIEAALYPLITNLVSQYGNEVSASQLRQSILSSIGERMTRENSIYIVPSTMARFIGIPLPTLYATSLGMET